MSYSRPSLAELIARIRADLISRMQTDDVLRRSDAEVHARVVAGTAHGLYGYVEWLSKQFIYDTAEADYLERWADIWGVYRKGAAKASGQVVFTVAAGAVIEAGTVLQALDGTQYQTTADAVVDGETATAPIEAVNEGAAGGRSAGQQLLLVSPVLGVQTVAIAGELSGGSDTEDDESLRERFLTRIRTPPRGGAAADYVAWALEVPGVTRAWCYPLEQGFGKVVVRFLRDGDADPIPSAEEVAIVQAYIDALRPVRAAALVLAPVPQPLNFTLSVQPDTEAVRSAVAVELRNLIEQEYEPGGTLPVSHIRAAISGAAGEQDHTLVSPGADVVAGVGRLITMGEITWL